MVNSHEPVKSIELDSQLDPEIEVNLVESSETEEELGVQNELVNMSSSEPVSLKRASTDEKKSQAKKQKQHDQSEKKQLFQRLWSEADEIVILKGMIDYAALKKADPFADLNAFREFIKKDIHFEFSGSQLKNKIMKLRTKFKNKKSKEKKGKSRTFSNPHKQEAYELSEKVWNCEGKVLGGSWSKKKKKENKEGGITGQTAEQWKRLKIKEIEAYMAQLEEKIANVRRVLDHLKTTV